MAPDISGRRERMRLATPVAYSSVTATGGREAVVISISLYTL